MRNQFTLSITLQGLPKSMNGSHGYWRAHAAERKHWRQLCALYAKAEIGGRLSDPLTACRVECVRHSSRQMDFDNLVASFKGCIDGLKDAGVIIDDKDSVIIERSYKWEKTPRGQAFVSIKVVAL